ncbi:hypothetical protein TYRP_007578 [Tyrophagus putrescentiae]|nr:hypothetical protein TYRP_007578 [Tyrophagus putrescentiae]
MTLVKTQDQSFSALEHAALIGATVALRLIIAALVTIGVPFRTPVTLIRPPVFVASVSAGEEVAHLVRLRSAHHGGRVEQRIALYLALHRSGADVLAEESCHAVGQVLAAGGAQLTRKKVLHVALDDVPEDAPRVGHLAICGPNCRGGDDHENGEKNQKVM